MRKVLIIAGLAVCLVLIVTGIVTVAFRSSEDTQRKSRPQSGMT